MTKKKQRQNTGNGRGETVMSEYSYSAGYEQECWHEKTSRIDFPTSQKIYGGIWDYVASDLANDYHSNHDGWEASWPLQIRIYKDNVEISRFVVEKEMEPAFYVQELVLPVTDK